MNGWEIFTWLSAIALAVSAVVIFGFFLRDARGILERDARGENQGATRDDGEVSDDD
jgi:hypothetical protein